MSQSISSAIVISNEAAEMSALLEAVRAQSVQLRDHTKPNNQAESITWFAVIVKVI